VVELEVEMIAPQNPAQPVSSDSENPRESPASDANPVALGEVANRLLKVSRGLTSKTYGWRTVT